MLENEMQKIHRACQKFREAIEEGTGNKNVFIGWCILEGEELASGITLGEEIGMKELADIMFRLNGRAYKLIQES